MALHAYTLTDGSTQILCPLHAALAETVRDDGREPGGTWKCAVCTTFRRLSGKAEHAHVAFFAGYTITKFPDGVTMCTCASWKFQRVPVVERSCKHTDYVLGNPAQPWFYADRLAEMKADPV